MARERIAASCATNRSSIRGRSSNRGRVGRASTTSSRRATSRRRKTIRSGCGGPRSRAAIAALTWATSSRTARTRLACATASTRRRSTSRRATITAGTNRLRDSGILAADSVARRINRESFLLLGGTAALLMQVAHPLVAAGVDQHSDFRRAPLPRLVRTVDATLAVVFGDRGRAERALRRIDRVHGPVRGTAEDGRPYRARDPRLMLWVQTTLVLTSLRWYEMVMGRLSDGERSSYWDEGKFFAGALGVPPRLFPDTLRDLIEYERTMLRTEVIPDATA